VTNELPAAEPVPQQYPPSTAAADAVTSPTSSDPSHARGGHGIFGQPMVSLLSCVLDSLLWMYWWSFQKVFIV